MLNPVISNEYYDKIKEVLFSDNHVSERVMHSIPLSEVLESYKIDEEEFISRLSDPRTAVINAMSNISKADKLLDKAVEKYTQSKEQLNDSSVDMGKRASDFFSSQASVNQSIHSLNVQYANAYYVLLGVLDQFLVTKDKVNEKLSDYSNEF